MKAGWSHHLKRVVVVLGPVGIQRDETREREQEKDCHEGWLPTGAKVPIRLTKRQEDYCRRAEGVRRSATTSTLSSTEVAN